AASVGAQPRADAPFADDADHGRRGEDAQIEREATIADVRHVQEPREALAAAGVELREPDDARPHAPADVVRVVVPAEPSDSLAGQGPRADEAHLAPQHVDELRQLVEAGLTQPASRPGRHAVAHRAELVDAERLPVGTDAGLREQHRSAVVQPDQPGDQEQQRAREDEPRGCDCNVDRTLQRHRSSLSMFDHGSAAARRGAASRSRSRPDEADAAYSRHASRSMNEFSPAAPSSATRSAFRPSSPGCGRTSQRRLEAVAMPCSTAASAPSCPDSTASPTRRPRNAAAEAAAVLSVRVSAITVPFFVTCTALQPEMARKRRKNAELWQPAET